eukprot:GEMP01037177.1.p1 GENE.GEMP01037177.1~~GEMP01037177.1.p1  ORF type:complete len:361 (+),score=64.83 GEMP01037177.1:92-1174(+)
MIQIPVATHFLSSRTSTSKCAALAKVSGSDAGAGRASKSEFSVCQSTNHRQSWANMSTPESRPSVFPRFWADIEVDEDDFGIESDVCSKDPAIINDNRDEQVITTLNVRDQSERDIFCKKAQYAFVPQQSDCQVALQENPANMDDSYAMKEHEFSQDYSNHINFSQQSDYQLAFQQNTAIVGDSYPMEEHEFFPDYSNHMNLSEQSDYMHKALVDCGIQPVPISILDSLDDEMKTISKHGKTVESPPVPVSILLSIDSDDCAGNDEKSDVRDGPGNFKSTIMVSPAAKERVVRALHGCTLDSDNARVCQVVDAKLHGLDANIELFYKSAVLPKLKKQYYPVVVEHGVVKRLPPCPAKIMK